jgi:DNA modification methylase
MILNANALHIPLASGTVQTCVTSVPYFHQRDYNVQGQIGLEPTMQEYIGKLVAVFREVRRVLRDDGTLWINIDDTFAGGNGNGGVGPASKKQVSNRGSYFGPVDKSKRNSKRWGGGNAPSEVRRKNLMMIPARLAIDLQDDGWYVRCDCIWEKPNAMPESVTDRPSRSHEYLFLLSKSQKYYYNADAIKEKAINNNGGAFSDKYAAASPAHGGQSQYRRSQRDTFKRDGNKNGNGEKPQKRPDRPEDDWDIDYRNKRSVWTINTQNYNDAHFATYPEKLVEPCILAGSREGDIVLDPFSGSGATGKVAIQYRRRYVGLELNMDYIALSRERTTTDVMLPMFAGTQL